MIILILIIFFNINIVSKTLPKTLKKNLSTDLNKNIDKSNKETEKIDSKNGKKKDEENYKIKKFKSLKSIKIKRKKDIFYISRLDQENKKEFYVNYKELKNFDLKLGTAFLIHRRDNQGFFTHVGNAIFVKKINLNGKDYYKFATYVKKMAFILGDKLSFIGKPTDEDTLAKLRHSMMDYANISRELGDFYFGSMSIGFSYGISSLSSSSSGPYNADNPFDAGEIGKIYSSDINKFKNYNSYVTYNFNFRWWFFFLSTLGLNFDYSFTPTIPTTTFNEEEVSSSFSGYGISLMYRRKFFRMPAIFGIKYFSDSFKTENDTDYLLSSKYSGINVNLSWHFPYKFTIIPLKIIKMVFHDLELGLGISPIVFASDEGYSRGSRPNITSYRLESGILFNFESEYLDFLKNIFFGIKYQYVTYTLNFTGETNPPESMPDATISKETYSYIGLWAKYEFGDPFGD